jgi:3-oxoacyl-[acyl-carrier protein] reductase
VFSLLPTTRFSEIHMTTEIPVPSAVFPDLEGKIVLITGAARGIGRSIAEEFAKQKSHLMLVDLDPSVEQTAAEIAAAYATKADFRIASVTDSARVKEVVEETVEPYGKQLHVLVNNAGITRDGAAMRMSDENWEAVISTNLTGTHNFCKTSIRYLRKCNGAIVNISSISGQIGNIGQTNYCAAKGGVIAYTKALAIEYPGLRCTAICPGFINTDMTARLPSEVWKYATAKTKLKRAGEPWEIAQAVVRSAAAYGNTYAPCAIVTVAGGMELGG